jgi:hypothetical protein
MFPVLYDGADHLVYAAYLGFLADFCLAVVINDVTNNLVPRALRYDLRLQWLTSE